MTTDATVTSITPIPAACRLVGIEPRDIKGSTLGAVASLVDESDRKLLADPVQQALHSGATVNLGRRAVLLAARQWRRALDRVSASPICSRKTRPEEVTGTVLLLHDVTELRGTGAPDVLPGHSRRADRPGQPPRIRAPACRDALAGRASRRRYARAVLSRSGSLQGRQRHQRASGRRQPAARGRQAHARGGARLRYGRAPRR